MPEFEFLFCCLLALTSGKFLNLSVSHFPH